MSEISMEKAGAGANNKEVKNENIEGIQRG